MSGLIIAIDGPSASGKSTVSRKVAERLKCVHVDSGSLYRGITWYFLSHNVKVPGGTWLARPASPESMRALTGNAPAQEKPGVEAQFSVVAAALNQIRLDFFIKDNATRFTIDGVEPDAELRSETVNDNVSRVAALPPVRDWVVTQLRKMTSFGGLVMEGRDIGTVVFPGAQFKFYLDADPEERARRRHLERQNEQTGVDDVLRSIQKRDQIDSSRAMAPLKVANGALVIESTGMSADEVADLIVKHVRQKGY